MPLRPGERGLTRAERGTETQFLMAFPFPFVIFPSSSLPLEAGANRLGESMNRDEVLRRMREQGNTWYGDADDDPNGAFVKDGMAFGGIAWAIEHRLPRGE